MRRGWLYWLPRALSMLFVLFVSMFAMDVFWEYKGWKLLLAFVMHMVPSFVLIGVLILAWKLPKWGGAAFLLLGVVFTFWFDTYREVIGFLLISLPVLVVGGLFLWEGLRER
ncbi:hypothetical protein GF367_03550 [Candidatus Woesearchaeota archaeon]|nr:hypothetical protein [Candidatus Woesearchaeota archaeon]